ncbi:hypothetical protein [Microbulbifer sp.]|uniref:hypothetical protein n=1 Tax=Microbulbifer sp. TaxID=1908541 RepID=UPI003F2E2119
MKTTIALLLLVSAPSFSAECDRELAKKVGVKAIKNKFPKEHDEHKPFGVTSGKKFWFIVPEVVERYSRGRGWTGGRRREKILQGDASVPCQVRK